MTCFWRWFRWKKEKSPQGRAKVENNKIFHQANDTRMMYFLWMLCYDMRQMASETQSRQLGLQSPAEDLPIQYLHYSPESSERVNRTELKGSTSTGANDMSHMTVHHQTS